MSAAPVNFRPSPSIQGQNFRGPLNRATGESYLLVEIDNDNDGTRSRLSARTDASGLLTHLEYQGISDPSQDQLLDAGQALVTCIVSDGDRNSRSDAWMLDTSKACGVEMDHATGNTSAIRLYSPDLDPASGGRMRMIFLKYYAIFGSHEVGFLDISIGNAADGWGLYAYGPAGDAPKRLGGLFIHKASRGIGSITACVKTACPAEWSHPKKPGDNDHLPPVWDPVTQAQ